MNEQTLLYLSHVRISLHPHDDFVCDVVVYAAAAAALPDMRREAALAAEPPLLRNTAAFEPTTTQPARMAL